MLSVCIVSFPPGNVKYFKEADIAHPSDNIKRCSYHTFQRWFLITYTCFLRSVSKNAYSVVTFSIYEL